MNEIEQNKKFDEIYENFLNELKKLSESYIVLVATETFSISEFEIEDGNTVCNFEDEVYDLKKWLYERKDLLKSDDLIELVRKINSNEVQLTLTDKNTQVDSEFELI